MRFLVDAQLPPALARFLSERGHDAHHVMDLGMEKAPDRAIWIWAEEHGAAIVTKDEGRSEKSRFFRPSPRRARPREGSCTWMCMTMQQKIEMGCEALQS